MAFAYFWYLVITDPSDQLVQFTTTGTEKSTTISRRKSKDEIKKENKKEQNNLFGNGNCGIYFEQQQQIATTRFQQISTRQSQQTEERWLFHGDMMTLHTEEKIIMRQQDQIIELIDIYVEYGKDNKVDKYIHTNRLIRITITTSARRDKRNERSQKI